MCHFFCNGSKNTKALRKLSIQCATGLLPLKNVRAQGLLASRRLDFEVFCMFNASFWYGSPSCNSECPRTQDSIADMTEAHQVFLDCCVLLESYHSLLDACSETDTGRWVTFYGRLRCVGLQNSQCPIVARLVGHGWARDWKVWPTVTVFSLMRVDF